MLSIKARPYHIFIITGILMILSSFFVPDEFIYFQLRDTNFVFSYKALLWVIATLLFCCWLLYFLTSRWLYSMKWSWISILLTVIPFIAFVLAPAWENLLTMEKSPDYKSWTRFNHYNASTLIVLLLIIIVFVSGQLIYLLNLVWGLINKTRSR